MQIFRGKDIEVSFTSEFQLVWNDKGSGAHQNVAFYHSVARNGFWPVGDLCRADYGDPNGRSATAIVRDISPDQRALARPVGYLPVWFDKGSGADRDGSLWMPLAPAGYVAMGLVSMPNYSMPSLDRIRCVRADQVIRAFVGPQLWADHGSGADSDLSVWRIAAPSAGEGDMYLTAGTFVGHASHNQLEAHMCAHAFRLAAPEPLSIADTPLVSPVMRSYAKPSPFEEQTVRQTIELPWFAVSDPGLSDGEKLLYSPVYRLQREDRYKQVFYNYNKSSVAQSGAINFLVGLTTTDTTTFSSTTGIELSAGFSIKGMVEVSTTLSQSFTYERSRSVSNETSVQYSIPVISPPGTAVTGYAIHSTFRLFRKDGTQVGQTVSCMAPDSIYFTQYPPAPEPILGGGRQLEEAAIV